MLKNTINKWGGQLRKTGFCIAIVAFALTKSYSQNSYLFEKYQNEISFQGGVSLRNKLENYIFLSLDIANQAAFLGLLRGKI